MKNVMIAATGSGSGKTTFATGLMNILKDRNVHAFKCGPDYIDPMFHKEVLGIPSTNLDSFFCDKEQLKAVFYDNAGDINIIEAAMGLYDGIGVTKKTSAYETATALNVPIVLLVNGYGMGYSIIPMIKGFLLEDSNRLIKGIVINRISEKYYKKIAPVIEEARGIKVYGFIPKIKDAELKSRHLGLLTPKEAEFKTKISLICSQLEDSVDIESILKDCEAEDINDIEEAAELGTDLQWMIDDFFNIVSHPKIAIAKDEAFSFIYEENIKCFERAGGRVCYFSPIHDDTIPNDCDLIVLYGGYPENYAMDLSQNRSMLSSIREANDRGVKIIAECGGFMYLLDSIEVDGINYDMAGIIAGRAYRTKSLVRFGYVSLFSKELTIKGHEFHHYDVDGVKYSDDIVLKNASSGEEYKGIVCTSNIFAGFPHLYYLSVQRTEL